MASSSSLLKLPKIPMETPNEPDMAPKSTRPENGTTRCGTSVCACVWNVRWNVCELCKSVLLHKRVTFPLYRSAVE